MIVTSPAASVLAVAEASEAPGPVAGPAKLTAVLGTGLPYTSVTRTRRGWAKAVPTVAACGLPL